MKEAQKSAAKYVYVLKKLLRKAQLQVESEPRCAEHEDGRSAAAKQPNDVDRQLEVGYLPAIALRVGDSARHWH